MSLSHRPPTPRAGHRSQLPWGLGAVASVVLVAAIAIAVSMRPTPSPPVSPLVTLRGTSAPRGEPPEGAPNLVLVIGCTVRRDQTSIATDGHVAVAGTTPFLAQLALDGVYFDDLVAAAPWTRAASSAILTGHHPLSIGMNDPSDGLDQHVLPPDVVTLSEHLHAHGYTTLGLTTNPNLNDVYGFEQGFDAYRELAKLWREHGVKLPGIIAVEESLALLDEYRPDTGPVYLQIVLIDAHAPHPANNSELEQFADRSVPEQVIRYRVALSRLDAAVEALYTKLTARGLDTSNTLFVFVNDHGEGLSFPAHHGQAHGRFLAPSSVAGLFVASGPGISPRRVVYGLSSQIDIAPTLVGMLGLPPMPADGQDLSVAIRGERPDTGRTSVFSDTWFKEVQRSAIYTDTRACQLDFSRDTAPEGSNGFVDGCFDRRSDPTHLLPHRDRALEDELTAWRDAQMSRGSQAPVGATLDPATARQLRDLGYLD